MIDPETAQFLSWSRDHYNTSTLPVARPTTSTPIKTFHTPAPAAPVVTVQTSPSAPPVPASVYNYAHAPPSAPSHKKPKPPPLAPPVVPDMPTWPPLSTVDVQKSRVNFWLDKFESQWNLTDTSLLIILMFIGAGSMLAGVVFESVLLLLPVIPTAALAAFIFVARQ